MVPRPVALGLTICGKVIVEEGTRNVSLIDTFWLFQSPTFPYSPLPFYVFATLTGSQGEGELALTVTNLATDEEVPVLTQRIAFPDRFAEIRITFRLAEFIFPEAGDYVFTLLVDDDWVAQRRVSVQEPESES